MSQYFVSGKFISWKPPDTHTTRPITPIHLQWQTEAVIVARFIPNEMITARKATRVPLLLLLLTSATYETFDAYDKAVDDSFQWV